MSVAVDNHGLDHMPTWNADQYLKFAEERTQPCRDLAMRVSLEDVRTIVDLGCGPGNSTQILAHRWPAARITGVDNSHSMIDIARIEQAQHQWVARDIVDWASHEDKRFDVVFSNAALQWVHGHDTLYPDLFARVAPGGALAIQIPSDVNSPPHRLMREIASPGINVREWHAHTPRFYYDLLAPISAHVEMWETEYHHVLPDAEAIVEWYKGTGLRPFLEALKTDSERESFLAEYLRRIRPEYPLQSDGKVLFPFRRLFLIAYR
jgi:trans-aconitate 2-methyltransferase